MPESRYIACSSNNKFQYEMISYCWYLIYVRRAFTAIHLLIMLNTRCTFASACIFVMMHYRFSAWRIAYFTLGRRHEENLTLWLAWISRSATLQYSGFNYQRGEALFMLMISHYAACYIFLAYCRSISILNFHYIRFYRCAFFIFITYFYFFTTWQDAFWHDAIIRAAR